jgi:hypothetical protein
MTEFAGSSMMGTQVAFYWMKYMFAENRHETSYKNCRTLDEIAGMLFNAPSSLYMVDGNICCAEDPECLGFLCSVGYDESVRPLLTDDAIDYARQYDMLFDLFENNVREPRVRQMLHHAYGMFGPKAYLVWWQANLPIYEFSGKRAKRLEADIMSVRVDVNEELIKQRVEIGRLEQYYREFQELFKVDYIMGLAGIRRPLEKDYIYCARISGSLGYDFLGQAAPIGFKTALQI